MLFFEIKVDLNGNSEKRDAIKEIDMEIAFPTTADAFFEKHNHFCHIAIVGITYRKQKCLLCAATRNEMLTDELITEFLRESGLTYKRFEIAEITLKSYFSLLRASYTGEFISDEDYITDKLNIAELNTRTYRSSPWYSEGIFNCASSKDELLKRSKELLCDNSLPVEINRIYQGASIENANGHPVHYLLQTDNCETQDKILAVLLSALYENGRIKSRRFCKIPCDGYYHLQDDQLNLLYESCAGATVVVSFTQNERDDGEYAAAEAALITKLCVAMRKARNSVLTVFCMPEFSRKTKDKFLENLGAITVVPICEEEAFNERAREHLRYLAKAQGARPDKALYEQLEEGKSYTPDNLRIIFDEWYDRRLKTKVYAQYADLETSNKQIALQKPRGSAIEELTSLIGLQEAKAVIRQALDFNKAQKLFCEKGFSAERPSMHMVFTGNPGTAKTTVARLFAEIMKDNGLLSVGDLHEVGRADLVGKYVGWTANIVKRKFKAAKGSVLFIDEAYSLVDDKDGLYGDEAINTIVQEMENNREDIVVIFAGYPDKMAGFLQKNPGLRSRIAFHVQFDDYSAEELCDITELMAKNKKIFLAEGTRDKLMPIYEKAICDRDFGNGRFVRNLFQKAMMNQAARLLATGVNSVKKSDIDTLLPEDFTAPSTVQKQQSQIGFACDELS